MKIQKKALLPALTALFLAALMLFMAVSCGNSSSSDKGGEESPSSALPSEEPSTTPAPAEHIDFASQLKLNEQSETLKERVTVHTFVDGDTTHFNLPEAIGDSMILKARYLAINTPESTGKIEEYGKKASKFTKQKLENAAEILVESDDGKWNVDSTGGRHLVWVWYKPDSQADFRCLNVELLQEGLAIASNAAGNRYGTTCTAAIAQARVEKLNVYSGQKDPDFFYGDAVELTLKELRTNVADYNGVKVAFEGVITDNYNNSVYAEDFDPETGLYYGMAIYLGYGLPGDGLAAVAVGNRARIVGTVQYYEAGETYQVSGLTYRVMKPDDPNNVQKLSDGHKPAYAPLDPEEFASGTRTLEVGEEEKSFRVAELLMNTSVSMTSLHVDSVYTTESDTASDGALTLSCTRAGVPVSVRTVPFRSADGTLVTADAYRGKDIDVKGLVDYYAGAYQIKVFSSDGIVICGE